MAGAIMTRKLASLCTYDGCSVVVFGDTRCPGHRTKTTRRRSAARRGYDHYWRTIRDYMLAGSPPCADCRGPATEVDHVLPLARGGTHHPSNLQAVCQRCHARRTATRDMDRSGDGLFKGRR